MAAEPVEPTDSRGRTTKRRYYILGIDGPGKFHQLSWYEDGDAKPGEGKLVERGTPNAKKQSVRLARDPDDALAFGYAVLGAPPEGIRLIAVAALHFQPKMVKPKPVVPTRTRLQIG
jgi:hypothetical protein